MKKYLLLLLSTTFSVTVTFGREAGEITITNIAVEADQDIVRVSFSLGVGTKAAPRGTTVIYAPVLTDGEYKISLPAIIVEDGRAKRNRARREWAAGISTAAQDGFRVGSGSSLEYSAWVPFQPWMQDARIDIEQVTAACCTSQVREHTLISGILPAPPQPEPLPEPEPVAPTIVEYLAEAFPFILPASDFDPNEPLRFYNDERDKAITIYYGIDSHTIDRSYAGNDQALKNLLAAIRMIRESGQADVSGVVVAGFSSPDGSFEYNDYMAWQRAKAIEGFILQNTDLPADHIFLFNGSADWNGLRREILADPNVPAREEALSLIDNHPVWNARTRTGRQTLLRRLNGGRTYRYLADNIFPKLRSRAFIRVYFEEK